MDQGEGSGLDASVGYALKEAQAALRMRMDEVLRPLGLTMPQYACLRLLGERPGLSNSELARGTFVTRQSMNVVLRALTERGLVERAATAATGRALPARLSPAGRALLGRADAAADSVESQMLSGMSDAARGALHAALAACVRNLTGPADRRE